MRRAGGVIALSFAVPLVAALADEPPHGHRGPPPGPPPEALAACADKAPGATASFTDREGRSVTGTCVLVLKPNGPPPGQPPEGAPPK
jgi:hypothetical protein